VIYLGEVIGGVIGHVDDDGRQLAVLTDEGEWVAFSLERATATFVAADGRGGARLRFLGD